MAAATDELILLERVFLCLGSADTDEQLQSSVCKFLPPVLLKLSSPQEGVRKKVMGLLIHINKRVKSRPKVQLPVEALLLQYQDPAASSFVINFTIIYIKLGYPRMDIKKQAELVPSVLNAIEGKPLPHQDSLLLIIMPALGHIQSPINADKRAAVLGLQDKPYVAKQLINFMLDMLLLPYGSVGQTEGQQAGQPIDWSKFPVPPGLSEYSFKRVIGEIPPLPEQLEQVKLGIVKFLAAGFFPESDVLIHLIVAAADTRFSVANLADMELRKIVSSLDWSSMQLALPLYTLFLGSSGFATQKDMKPEMKRLAANTRIRLKLLQYLCRVNKSGLVIPPAIQVVFDSLYGNNTNKKLKSLALEFALNMVQQCSLAPLTRVAGVILNGMVKLIAEGEVEHQSMAYTIIGQLGQRIPTLVNKDVSLVEKFFDALTTTDGELRRTVRDALVSMASSFVLDRDNEQGIALMNSLLSVHIESQEANVRYVAVHYAATVFPADNAPSRYLLLLACGDEKTEVSAEAIKALYGTVHRNERDKSDAKEYYLPDFPELVLYINWQMGTRIKSNRVIRVGNQILPYNIATFNEIVSYLRLCLAKSANIKVQGNPIENHPCEHSPLIGRYLKDLLKKDKKYLDSYLEIIKCLNHSNPDKVSLTAFLEVVGSISPEMCNQFAEELPFLRGQLSSTKADVRELSGKIHAIIMAHQAQSDDFDVRVNEFIAATKNKTLEIQHGAILALAFMFERKLILRKANESKETLLNWKSYVDCVQVICSFLKSSVILLAEAATQGIGIIGKSFSLPLNEEDTDTSKKSIIETLFSILTNAKMSHKIKENAATSLGLLCIGENFPYSKDIIDKFINLTKETKDSSMHFTIAEALVLCVQGQAAKEARDAWTTLPEEHDIEFTQENDNHLVFLLDELLKISSDPHPNSRQAVCIWLLAILRRNAKRKHVLERLPAIQNTFMDFLSENNDIVQDAASKGICLVYDTSEVSQRDALVSNLLGQLSEGRRTVAQVTPDTKLFEDGQLGKAPTGANISTYKEICSLASDLNNPSLIYKFLQLANHNAIWNSKKGAAFGFSAIASVAKDELNKYLPTIVPKLYRYQFDPTPKIQQSMASIWHAIVPSTQKALEQYHDEILDDLTVNLTSHLYRVRISCCEALCDLLKSNAPINYVKHSPELWKQLFRVMDDIHEETRQTATRTAKLFSKVCIRQCDPMYGKTGEQVVQAILPVFLDIGIIHTVASIRALSIQTVAQLVSTAGALLKPSLVNLIPALLTATDLESTKLTYMSNAYGAQSDIQEAIDSVRTSAAKSHYATETLKKCTQYIDASILKELMPKVVELIKSSIGLGSKVAISHFLIFLLIHLKQEVQPYAGRILTALMNGLTDRNAAVRKTNAVTIGHVVGSAKDSSLEKLFNTLNTWYMEREDDSIRLAIGQTLQSINNQNHEVLKKFSDIVMPLTFFAMHAIKVPGNENTIELWTDLWGEIAHGTESAIKQNLALITGKLNSALESPSWTTKAQAANAVSTVAIKVGSTMDENSRNSLLKILVNGLQGRTWNGKERLVNALATLACNSKEALGKDPELTMMITEILYKESKKDNLEYRRHALKAFGDVLHELEVDRFTQLYDIAQEILIKLAKKNDDDDSDNRATEEATKKREDQMKLQETVYEALGKAWPSTMESKSTQDEYCLQFVNHCKETMPNSTRPIQVAIMTTLTRFVEKLIILKLNNSELTENDTEKLNKICESLHQILRTSIGISKYTRIRKEALNIILILSKKLIDNNNTEQLVNLKNLFCELLPDLTQDNQPEVVNLRQSFDNAVGNSRDRAFALDTTSAMIQTLILCKRNDDAPYLSASTEVSAKYKGAFCEIKICKVVRSVQRRVMYKQGLGTATGIGDPIKRTIRIGPSVEARRTDKKEFVEAAITKIQVCSLYTIVFDDGHITALSRTALCLKSGLVAAATVHDTVRIRVEEDYLVMLFKDAKYYTVWKRERTEFTKMLGLKVENPEKDKFSPKYNTQSLPEEEETPLVLSSSSPSSSAAEDPSKQIMKDEEAPGERSSICNLKSDVNIEAKSTTESSSFKKLQITPFMPVLSNRKLPKPVKEEPTKKSVRKKQQNSSSSSSTFFQSSTSTAPGEKQKSGEENPTKAWSKSKEDKESRKMRACSKHRMTEDDVKIQQRGREKGEENEKIREKDESSGAEWASCYKGSIQLGDRLKVYYGQTHESKVTLGAKVIGLQRVEEGAQFDYLLHYRSWNTRYDEWTKVTRIAPNFPLTQRCMKRTVTKPQPQTPSATASAEALNRIKEPVDQPKLTTTEKKKEESARGVIKPKKEEDDQKIGRGVDLMTTNAKFLERRSNEKLQIDPLKKISESNDLDKQTWKKILSQEFLDFTDSSDSEQKLVINNPKEKCDEEIKVEEPESSTFDIKVMDESAGRSMGEEKLEKKIVILKMPFAYAPTSGAQGTSQGELPMKVASSCEVQGAIGHGMLQPVVWQREAQIKVVVGGMQMINQNGQECNEAALVMDNTPLTTPDSTISNVSVSPREEKTRKSPTSKNNGKTKGVESHFEEGLAETLGMGEKGEVKRPMKDSETPRKWNRKRTRSGSITRQEAGANHSDDTSEGSTERTSIGQMEKVVNGVGEMLGKDQKHLKYIFYMELNLKIDECQEIAVLQQQLFEKGLQPRKNRISCN